MAGLREAEIQVGSGGASSEEGSGDASQGAAPGETAGVEEQPAAAAAAPKFEKLLHTASQSIQSLSASKTSSDGQRALDEAEAVQSVELNENPRVGAGKGPAMKLVVQLAHLAAWQYLLRLHLANNQIEDEGMQVCALGVAAVVLG